jgi:hypothetical protein
MLQDTGYSNWTVEETFCYCLKDNNQYLPSEESYSWIYNSASDYKELRVAEQCRYFKEGVGMQFDVDGDVTVDDYKDDPELVEAYNQWSDNENNK